MTKRIIRIATPIFTFLLGIVISFAIFNLNTDEPKVIEEERVDLNRYILKDSLEKYNEFDFLLSQNLNLTLLTLDSSIIQSDEFLDLIQVLDLSNEELSVFVGETFGSQFEDRFLSLNRNRIDKMVNLAVAIRRENLSGIDSTFNELEDINKSFLDFFEEVGFNRDTLETTFQEQIKDIRSYLELRFNKQYIESGEVRTRILKSIQEISIEYLQLLEDEILQEKF